MFGGKLVRYEGVLIACQLALSVYVLLRWGLDVIGVDDFANVPPGKWGLVRYYAMAGWWVLAAVSAAAILFQRHWGWWLQCLVIAPLCVLVSYALFFTVSEGQREGYSAKTLFQGILLLLGIGHVQFLVVKRAFGSKRQESVRT